MKDLGFDGNFKLWWRTFEDVVEHKFRKLKGDNDATELARYGISAGVEVSIFVENSVDIAAKLGKWKDGAVSKKNDAEVGKNRSGDRGKNKAGA